MLLARNPATGEIVGRYEETPPENVGAILNRARASFEEWRKTSFGHRAGLMKNAARILRDRKEEFSRLMTLEMGKPIRTGRKEVEKCAWVCEYFAEHAEAFLKTEIVATDAAKSFVVYEPLGIILAVMPWNWPFWQVFRCVAPALMAGNGFVLKHADNVPGCALAIESVFRKAGFPDGLPGVLFIPEPAVKGVIENDAIAAVTLTGGPRAGREVARAAGAALKKTVLELGGSSPMIVLEDADLDLAVDVGLASRMSNNGQSCLALKRFVVVDPVREDFTKRLLEKMRAVRMGDPLLEDVDLGPLARPDLRDTLHRQVVESVSKGARLLLGGEIPPGPGDFYPPTVLADVRKGMPAYNEELFGPVAAIIPAHDEAEALHVAHDTRFGLGAAVMTADLRRGERIAMSEIDAGSCFVNAAPKSDPRLPFGGIKESGYGRELGSHGIRELVNVKVIYIK